jgi:hypothetical protein
MTSPERQDRQVFCPFVVGGETERPANQRFFLDSNSFNSSRMTKTHVYSVMAVVSGT